MCGIVGMFDTQARRTVDAELLSCMNEAQFHRGPDEGGLHTEPGLGFGHRRLSIIDLSSGQQPLFNEDGSVAVVFNGEIFNFQELMQELSALGHTFRTHCDTEVIVHAWEQWGVACVQRFRGMFAFGVWDRNQDLLFLARDRLGVKPLHYALLPDGWLVFGSELKTLLVHANLPRDLDPYAIEDYFAFGYVPEPRTIFKNALKLSPGYTLLFKRGAPAPTPKRYWDVPFQPHPTLSEKAMQEELVSRLREAVKIRLMSEVPLGAFLSGGVDSSAIVALMAGLMQEPVNTCSISFNDPLYDEGQFAAQVAERYHTRHHVEQVDTDDYALVDKLAALYDEPFADSSAIPTYRVCELARKRVTVALSGDGGDEDFAGYRRYKYFMLEQRLRDRIPLAVRKPLFGLLGRVYPKADWAPRFMRAKTTFEGMARDSVEGYFHGISVLSDAMRQKLFSPAFHAALGGYSALEVMRGHATNAPTQDPLSLVQYLDYKTYLPGDILTKVDRASMAHALEVRVPLLDHEFVEWVSGLPANVKLRGGVGKYIFKKSLEPQLSDDILYRAKMGFSVPLASWFRGPLKQRLREAVLGPTLRDTGFFNMAYLQELVEQHQSGVRDYSAALWSLLMFEAFMRQQPAAVQ